MTSRIYVGNLPMDIRTREVEDIFYKYGRILDIDIKFPSRPPAFAFVDFEDSRDADDAIRGRDGYEYDGQRLRVEAANVGVKRGGKDQRSAFPRNVRGTGEFCVRVTNLPPKASWQDLKDYMRKAGDVVFTEVDGRGNALVEYTNKDDMKYAVKKLDDTEFRAKFSRSYIHVKLSNGSNRSRSHSRSRSYSRSSSGSSRSRSYSRSRSSSRSRSRSSSHSPSRSRSRSRHKHRGRSRSSSRSRSPRRGKKYSRSHSDSRSRSRSYSPERSRKKKKSKRSYSRSKSYSPKKSRRDSHSQKEISHEDKIDKSNGEEVVMETSG